MDLSSLFTSLTSGMTCFKPLTDEISTWSKEKRLSVAIALSASFMLLEFAGGIYANSLAILTDAAHLLTDVASFAIALCAVIISKWKSTTQFSFGFKRAEILGALFSVIIIWILTIVLLLEAFDRFVAYFEGEMEPINGKVMTFLAAFGIMVNLTIATLFSAEHDEGFLHAHDHSHGHSHAHGGHDDHHNDDDDDDHDHHSHGHQRHSSGHNDEERGGCGGHDHGHGHHDSHAAHGEKSEGQASAGGHDHGHGHGHGHGHHEEEKEEKKEKKEVGGSCDGHSHGHGHSHSHHPSDSHRHDEKEKKSVELSPLSPGSSNITTTASTTLSSGGSDGGISPRYDYGAIPTSEGANHGYEENPLHAAHGHGHGHHHHGEGGGEKGGGGGRTLADHSRGSSEFLAESHSLVNTSVIDDSADPGGTTTIKDLNMHAAYLHILTDLLQSIGVMIAGILIWYDPGWGVIDPIITVIFAILILWGTFGIFNNISSILFEGVPAGIDYEDIKAGLEQIEGVVNVHHLHIWAISSDYNSLSCHISTHGHDCNSSSIVEKATLYCKRKNIKHVTIQIEEGQCYEDDC